MSQVKDVTKITSADWSPKLNYIGEIVEQLDDIGQCVKIIMSTPKGSDPHRPEFGCEAWNYLDLPTNLAIPQMILAITEAIGLWEPRAKISKIENSLEEHQLWLTVHWSVSLGSEQTQTTRAPYELAQLA